MSDTKAPDNFVSEALRCAISGEILILNNTQLEQAAAELAQLRTELDEARKVIIELTHPLDYDQQFSHAHAWLSAHPKEPK